MPKTILILLLCWFASHFASAQIETHPNTIDTVCFHLSPKNKHVVINGVAFGLTIHPWVIEGDTCFVEMNGLNIELGPLGIVSGIMVTGFGLIGVKDDDGNRASFFSTHVYLDSNYHATYGTFVNGVSLSIGGISETFNTGVIINGLSCLSHTTTGLLISGLVNVNHESRGVSMAGIANVAQKARGVQIGLINNCETGQVLQIGLFNRIGKRVVPIVNFSFRK
jgi:hypothetical protein